MEKNKFIVNLFFVLFLFIFSINFISSFSAVSPASYDVDFSPRLNKEFSFRFVSDESDLNFFASGELKDYVVLDVKRLKGQYIVLVKLSLPEQIETPGINLIRITASPYSKTEDQVSIVSSPSGLIRVRVPYPGKYAELDLTVSNVNAGEEVPFSLAVFSRGSEDIFVQPKIEIYERDNLIGKVDLPSKEIKSTQSYDYVSFFSSSKLSSGNYVAKAIVDYGGEKPSEISKVFRLGELLVEILNYTSLFERDKINRFEIEIESFWNDPINEVYAQVEVLSYGNNFLTPTIKLSPWQKSTLTGFLDTSGIQEDYFDANITLNYGGKQTSKVARLNFVPEFNYVALVWVSLAGIIIILLLVVIILMLLKRRRK